MRVYDGYTGKIKKVIGDLMDEKIPGDITAFCMGPRLRKFFIGDNSGLIRLYNIKSGEFIAPIVSTADIKARAGTLDKKLFKKSYEVSQVIFVEDQNIIITASCDSVIRVYEAKENDEAALLRELRGGHREADISVAEYCRETLTLYSGAVNGTIACWSFESSRLTAVFIDDENDITSMKDLFPYPCLLVANSRGTITCWRTKDSKKSYPLLFKVSVHDLASAHHVKSVSSLITVKLQHPLVDPQGDKRPVFSAGSLYEQDALLRPVDHASFKARPIEEVRKMMAPSFENHSHAEDSLHHHAIIGTGGGEVHIYNLDNFMRAFKVEELSAAEYNLKRAEKFKISLMRKDNVNGDKTSEKLHSEVMQLFPKEKIAFFLNSSVSVKNWKAHRDAICSLDTISERTEGFISAGKDKFVKVWSPRGELWGQFNIIHMTKPMWTFPYDWCSIILSELDEVFELVQKLDKMHLSDRQKEKLQARYLYNNYILPDLRGSKQLIEEAGDRKKMQNTSGQAMLEKIQFFHRLGDKYAGLTQTGFFEAARCARRAPEEAGSDRSEAEREGIQHLEEPIRPHQRALGRLGQTEVRARDERASVEPLHRLV